jgi:plastocyanin
MITDGVSYEEEPKLNSPDQATVLKPLPADAPQEARIARFALIQKIAMESRQLTIGIGCRVAPSVLKTKMGAELTFKNTDSAPHTIMFNGVSSFLVGANESIIVPATFGDLGGIYAYACDKVELAGMIWME